MASPTYDLVVIGAGPTGLSIASHAMRRGLERVVVLAGSDTVSPQEAMVRYALDVRHGFLVSRIESLPDHTVVVESAYESLRTGLAVVVESGAGGPAPFPVAESLRGRIHTNLVGFDPADADVLVVGEGDDVVEYADRLLSHQARVVVAFTGAHAALSRVAGETLAALEFERRLTVLWQSRPETIEDVLGYPMVFFADRHTPDLQFDHVVVCYRRGDSPAKVDGRVYTVDSVGGVDNPLGPARAWETIVARHADIMPPARPGWPRPATTVEIERLRAAHYNATITSFDFSHEDLWVIRVRPDHRDTTHRAGQYATLGLGYWEPRIDESDEGLSDAEKTRLIRRSYSISSRIFDEYGYLSDPGLEDEIEFYIVHVRPTKDRIPAFTPRLGEKRVGDRIYLGPKIAGRYTLDPLTDPEADVLFLATGTGEAPHNGMILELFRKGHRGRIVSLVTVRHLHDLAYVEHHRRLERYHPNYRYVPLPTREPGVPKRYIQELFESGEVEALTDHGLDPRRTHVYMCGNPAMIGLPRWETGGPVFPETRGMAEILHRRGFSLDRRGEVGNVHYEEYW